MKKFPLLLFVLVAQLRLVANDGVFYASGGNLFPLKETTISLEKEVLKFRISKDLRIYVDVDFEFNNPGEAKELTVGFVTPPASGDIAEEKTEHPQISNFTVQHNNTSLPLKYGAPVIPVLNSVKRWPTAVISCTFLRSVFCRG